MGLAKDIAKLFPQDAKDEPILKIVDGIFDSIKDRSEKGDGSDLDSNQIGNIVKNYIDKKVKESKKVGASNIIAYHIITSARDRDHKYIDKEWDAVNKRWNYTYESEHGFTFKTADKPTIKQRSKKIGKLLNEKSKKFAKSTLSKLGKGLKEHLTPEIALNLLLLFG